MIKNLLLGIGASFGVLAVVIATRPAHFVVERSLTMAAPAAAPFALVNDFHAWTKWSPFETMDPAMKRTYGGAANGVGAEYGWSGNEKAGEGHMTITDSVPAEKVGLTLTFTKPMAATNQTTFTFAPDGTGTKVTWRMEGDNNFIGKAFGLFVDFDGMVGPEFDKGLAAMKAEVEGHAASAAPVASGSDAGH